MPRFNVYDSALELPAELDATARMKIDPLYRTLEVNGAVPSSEEWAFLQSQLTNGCDGITGKPSKVIIDDAFMKAVWIHQHIAASKQRLLKVKKTFRELLASQFEDIEGRRGQIQKYIKDVTYLDHEELQEAV